MAGIFTTAEAFEALDNFCPKNDRGKPQLGLVSPYLIEAVGIIRTYGVDKYGDPDNWKQVDKQRYINALMRHLVAYLKNPEGLDEESGYPHLWHLACNVNFLVEIMAREAQND